MCRPSLVQPPEIRRLRDLTRYRRALVQDRTREQQRVEKLLEDAQIKISAVLSNLHGVTGRAIMDALIAGERDPRTLAGLAKASARKKTDRLEEALRGFFTDHHATILQMMLDNSDRISAQIAALDARIEEAIGPFSRPAARLADIPGVSTVAAAELIAEIGVDMTRFPSAAHLVSWAKFCPQIHQSAGKSMSKGRAKGNPWLAGTLGRIAFVNSRTDTFLGARYRRLARRRGKQKALVATGNSVLTVIYHLLSDPDARFCDLGPGYYESRINKHRRARDLATQLQALTGQTHRHPRRQSGHHRHRRLTPNPQPRNMTRLRRVAFGLPTHHPIFGSVNPAAALAAVEAGKWHGVRPGRRHVCDAV